MANTFTITVDTGDGGTAIVQVDNEGAEENELFTVGGPHSEYRTVGECLNAVGLTIETDMYDRENA